MTHDTESERGLPELPEADFTLDRGAERCYYQSSMRAYALAAIEKDRAERSEAVPVATVKENPYCPEGTSDELDRYLPAGTALYASPPVRNDIPERSDVQGAETIMLALSAFEMRVLGVDQFGNAEFRTTDWDYFKATLTAAALASRPAVQQEGWRPIESAPRDALLLLSDVDFPSSSGKPPVKVGGYWDHMWHVFGASWTPTHWRELPPAPTGEKP